MVAETTFWGLLERRHLVRISLMPAASSTARTATAGDDAGTGGSGLQQHAAGAEFTDHFMGNGGAVERVMVNMFFLASSRPLRMASGTSAGLAQAEAHLALLVAHDDQSGRTSTHGRP